MLNFINKRPNIAVTIYRPDMNLAVVEAQLRALSPAVASAFDNGEAALSVQEPTQSQMAGLILTLTRLTMTFNEINRVVGRVRQDLDIGFSEIELDIDLTTDPAAPSARMGFMIERFEPSAFASLISYTVADLPV